MKFGFFMLALHVKMWVRAKQNTPAHIMERNICLGALILNFGAGFLWNLSILFFCFLKTKNKIVKSNGLQPKVTNLNQTAPSLPQHLIPSYPPPLGS
jgi:hypothetical protein